MNIIEKSLIILRALSQGVDPTTGEIFPEINPYQRAATNQALYTAIKSLEGRPKRVPRELRTKKPRKIIRYWSIQEERKLRYDFQNGHTFEQLAKQHGRSVLAIRARLVHLGILQSRF